MMPNGKDYLVSVFFSSFAESSGHADIVALAVSGLPSMLGQSMGGPALSSSHPGLANLGVQHKAPLPYPGQALSSLNGSLGYSANLSSAGSDRASPSSGIGRTNLAAQMGFGSNPSLSSLEQLPQDQLTWQQQLLAQQQHQSSMGSFGHGSHFPGGFQNHLGHHLPAVPTWQNSAVSIGSLGQFGQNPRPGAHLGGMPGLQNAFPMQTDPLRAGHGESYLISPGHVATTHVMQQMPMRWL